MESQHENPFTALAELELNSGEPTSCCENNEVFAELRFGADELSTSEFSFEFGVSAANLSIELNGCEIVPGSRYGDAAKKDVERLTKATRRSTAERAVTGEAQTSSHGRSVRVGGLLAGSGRKSKEDTLEESSQQLHTDAHVRALPGKRWQIADPSGFSDSRWLNGTYLSNERLCSIRSKRGANRTEISATLYARPRDLILEPEGTKIQKEWRKLNQKNKMIKAIIARALKSREALSDNVRSDTIILARSKINESDDVS